jgi:hypothetical protein
MKALLSALLLGASVTTANAGFFNGNDIYKDCKHEDRSSFLTGYVSGWMDKWGSDDYYFDEAVKIEQGSKDQSYMPQLKFLQSYVAGNICVPEKVQVGQIVDVYCKYLKDNPAKRASSGDSLLMGAVKDAWQCPRRD